jgi:hypothetical protein
VTTNSITELLAAPLNPDWTIEELAEQLLCTIAAQSEKEFVLDATAITDRQSRRLIRPLLACLANMSATESGTPDDIYGGHLSFKRVGPDGPVLIIVQFENQPGNVRAAFKRSCLPQDSTATAQKSVATPAAPSFDATSYPN